MKKMLKVLSVLTFLAAFAAPAQAAIYEIDPVHSGISFKVKHLMVTYVPGKFDRFSGWFEYDPKNMKVWRASATIEAASINTSIERRDNHLRSPDFFDAEGHPTLEFRSKEVVKEKDGSLKLKGDLTLRGVTKPVVLNLEEGGTVVHPQDKKMRAGFTATGKINRTDFGVKYNQLLEAGGMTIGEEVFITIEIQGKEK